MATHSGILAWRSPWTEEPSSLQSTGSQRVEQDLATTTNHHYILVAPLVAQTVKRLPVMQETWVRSLGQEDLLEKGMATLQCSCLENPMDRGAWWATVHGVTKS